MAVFLVPFSIVQCMPNLFYGALLCVPLCLLCLVEWALPHGVHVHRFCLLSLTISFWSDGNFELTCPILHACVSYLYAIILR